MPRLLQRQTLLALLLLPALAMGPIGCGGELAAIDPQRIIDVIQIVESMVRLSQVKSADLDCTTHTLLIQGMQDGEPVTVTRKLDDREYEGIASSGRVEINGQTVDVSRSR